MDKRIVRTESRKVPFGRFSIKKDIYYLQPYSFGFRIEVSNFSYTKTQEIKAVWGDDLRIHKEELEHYTFKELSKKELERKIIDLIDKLYKKYHLLSNKDKENPK